MLCLKGVEGKAILPICSFIICNLLLEIERPDENDTGNLFHINHGVFICHIDMQIIAKKNLTTKDSYRQVNLFMLL